MAPQKIDLIPFFFIILSFVSCSLQDIPLNKYVEEVYEFGSQAYPSYLDMIDEGGNFSKDLIKQSSDVLSLKSFDKVDGTSASVNVNDLGAEGDGETDDTEVIFLLNLNGGYFVASTRAFAKAWKVACSSNDEAVLVVPEKIYYLTPIRFSGPCKSEVTVQILGTLKASDNRSDFSQDGRHWLVFDTVRNLLVEGGGVINGNGEQWWQNSCKINKSKPCKDAPTALIFQECKNLRVNNLNIQDAQQIHVSFQKCMNVQASNLSIIAPQKSPNTDGIHVTNTQNILITNSVIATGDDCLSIVNGCEKVQATNITCGPGHGIRYNFEPYFPSKFSGRIQIDSLETYHDSLSTDQIVMLVQIFHGDHLSIGSLGSGNSKAYVSEITVNGAILSGTTNGVRIKTWQGGSGRASNITFENIEMHNVSNPIIIDQNYCDRKPCKEQRSAVQVEDVVYKNISGTSASDVAIKFDCSKSFPCEGIVLQGINIQREEGKTAKALCNNIVNVTSIGVVSPICH